MQFNFKRSNAIQRKLKYDHVLEDYEQVSFEEIDSHLRTDYLETKLREILVEQVAPIVQLSKKNLLYNAQKNTQLEEMKEFVQEICNKLEETRNDLQNLSAIKAIVKAHWEN